jgi:protein SCO1/2
VEPRESDRRRSARRLVWAGLIGVLGVVAAMGVLSLLERAPRGGTRALQDLGEVPPFRLVERSGRTVSRDELLGSPWIADFVFTRCAGVCPVLSARMARLQEKLQVGGAPSSLRLVSFSVDPAHDTPDVLRAYAERYGASERGWLFLTGEREALHALIKDGFRLSVAERDDPGGDPNEMITHSDRFVLVDRGGHIRGYYHGTDEESVARLVDDVTRLRNAPR